MSKTKDELFELKKAIIQYCLECCDDKKEEVKKCNYLKCPLWKYRMDINKIIEV